MAKMIRYELIKDRQGMVWDLLLYIPTVAMLFTTSAIFWYSGKVTWSYVLLFSGTFFTLMGSNRILTTRMMVMAKAPVALEVERRQVRLQQKNGDMVELLKNIRFHSDTAGRSFGLSGMDVQGKQRQYVFNKGQFMDGQTFKDVMQHLRVFR